MPGLPMVRLSFWGRFVSLNFPDKNPEILKSNSPRQTNNETPSGNLSNRFELIRTV